MNEQGRIIQKNLLVSLLVILLSLIVYLPPAVAHHHHKGEFLISVRASIEHTHRQLSPLTANCFSLADTDKLLRGIDSYVVGVAVDTDYLSHFKLSSYLSSFVWAQHPESGLTQPRYEDAGWGDIAFTPKEQRYSGWIILAQPPDVRGDTTAFHEAVHAYHLLIKSDADADVYGAPESITNGFVNVLLSLGKIDEQLGRVLEAKRTGRPFQQLERELERMINLRERTFNDFANRQFFEVLTNIGGKADWKCYRDLVKQTIEQGEERKPVRLEIRATHPQFLYRNKMTLLKGQSTILKAHLVYSDNSEEEVTTGATWAPHDFFSGGRGTFNGVREHWGVRVTAAYNGFQGMANIEVIDPRLTVNISASPPGFCGGEETEVSYLITIENPGIATLENVWVLDSLCSDLYVSGSKAVFPTFMGYYSTDTFECTKKISRETENEVIVTGEYIIDRPDGNSIRGTVEAKDRVVVSDGSVAVPFVVGWNVGTAVKEIRDKGLTIGRIRINRSDTVVPGNIISQAPEGGIDACLGDKVDLVRAWGAPGKEDDESDDSGGSGTGSSGLRAELDCGNAFELEPGDFVGKGCGVVVKGWAYNDVPVEVLVDFAEGSGISVFPPEDKQHPMNMYNPGISDYPDRYIFNLSFRADKDAPAGLTDFLITVRQVGTGEVVLPLSILVLEEGRIASKSPGIRPPAEVVTGSGGEYCVWRHKSFGDRPECFNFSRARCDNSRYADPKYELVGSAMTWRESGVRMAQLGSYHEDEYGCHTSTGDREEDDNSDDRLTGDDLPIPTNAAAYEEAKEAIRSCDLDTAKSLIDALHDGEKKTDLLTTYDTAVKLESQLKIMINREAKEKYKECDYDGMLNILNAALAMAECQTHKEKITQNIAAAQEAKQLEAELKILVNQEAKSKYAACDYDGALEALYTALSKAKCETHKSKISQSIAAAQEKKKQNDELKVMVNHKAKQLYTTCDFDGAINVLQSARSKTQCLGQQKKIDKSIAAARKRQEEENTIRNKVHKALQKHEAGFSAEARVMLSDLLETSRCNGSRDAIHNAITQIEAAEREERIEENNVPSHPGFCGDPGMPVTYKLIDPPPYSGVSLICGGSQQLWLQTAGGIHKITGLNKNGFNSDTGCYHSSQVITRDRTYGGTICGP